MYGDMTLSYICTTVRMAITSTFWNVSNVQYHIWWAKIQINVTICGGIPKTPLAATLSNANATRKPTKPWYQKPVEPLIMLLYNWEETCANQPARIEVGERVVAAKNVSRNHPPQAWFAAPHPRSLKMNVHLEHQNTHDNTYLVSLVWQHIYIIN